MRILILSAYHAISHKRWVDGLRDLFPECEWTVHALPPRFFSWRVRGNPLSWLHALEALPNNRFDLILATSMVDLACLRGLVRSLSTVPAIYYFHENQFAYPQNGQQNSLLEAQMVSLYGILSAELSVFNSRYNKRSFLQGLKKLIEKLPDEKPRELPARIAANSVCLPVGIQCQGQSATRKARPDRIQLVWNHRWEYDKGPERLLACIKKLPPALPLTLHVLGQKFRRVPPEFQVLEAILRQRKWLGRWGFIEAVGEYNQLLQTSHVALSTALHDFQGLAVMEACEAGCMPLVPDRLAYQEIFPPAYRYASCLDSVDREAEALAKRIEHTVQGLRYGESSELPSMRPWYWDNLKADYLQIFESTIDKGVSFSPFSNSTSAYTTGF